MNIKTVMVALAFGAALSGCVQNYATREMAQGAPPGLMTIVNAPPNARVILNGEDVGAAGQVATGVPLSAGRHDVVIVADGERVHAQAVVVAAGARVEVRVR